MSNTQVLPLRRRQTSSREFSSEQGWGRIRSGRAGEVMGIGQEKLQGGVMCEQSLQRHESVL